MNRECNKQFSVKVGTIMEDSAIGLDKWLAAIRLIANAKNGISSYEIMRALGVTQKSVWFLLHRIRLATQTGTFEKLSGAGGAGKAVVMGLLERHGNDSKVRTKVVFNRSQETPQGEVRRNIEEREAVPLNTERRKPGKRGRRDK